MATINRRIGYLFLVFILLLAAGLARAAYLGSVRAGFLRKAANEQQVTDVLLPAPRGTILDRNGIELAISQPADDIVADDHLIKHPLYVAGELSPLLGVPQLELLQKLSENRGFVYLSYLVPLSEVSAIEKLRIAGLAVFHDSQRIYPRSWSAAQVLGTVGWQLTSTGILQKDHGLSGLEYEYNRELQGTNGLRRIVSDARGQTIAIANARPMRPGKDLQLTLDAPLQNEVEQVLLGVGAQYSPRSATAIVMDPNTGGILALANWPRVNANDPFAAPLPALTDLPVDFNYEPGSTFKAITVASALQDGLITPSTPFNIPAVLQVADRQIHDAESHGDETLSVANILKYSSNIGADEIGMRLGAQRFDSWVHRFGFGAPTRVDLPGEQQGIVLHSRQYSGSSMGNLPMGQGESVTPMQMAAAYSVIANGGILRAPHIVASIGGKPVPLPKGKRIISPDTAYQVRSMLRGVLGEGGTASGACIPGYDMAGKTGTANVVVDGKYSNTEYIASFIGMVPTDHPRLVVAVVVNEPQGSIYGGQVAAPAFKKIVGWGVPYFGIDPRYLAGSSAASC